jgi:hypothetical protein
VFSDYLKILSSLYYYYFDVKSNHRNILGLSPDDTIKLRNILKPRTPLSIQNAFNQVVALLHTSK